jgi:hypothetical protein
MIPDDTLDKNLLKLAKRRDEVFQTRLRIDSIQIAIAQSGLGKELERQKLQLVEQKAAVESAEAAVRDFAVLWYHMEQPLPVGVKVVNATTLHYDQDAAIAWAAEHHQKVLSLRKRDFERAARVMEPDFVRFDTKPQARIAKDLSHLLEEEE